MLKKILGEAPLDVELTDIITVSPDKKCTASLKFVNTSEYDLPLSCGVKINSFVNVDKKGFDVIAPAEGVTSAELVFSVPQDSRLFGGRKICELEIEDRIFDTRTEYEFEIMCEAAYKCCGDTEKPFSSCENVLFTRDGVVFANKGERVAIEIPCTEKTSLLLHIISGEIKDFNDREIINLTDGLNRLCFEMTQDGSFEFLSPMNEEKIYPDTISPKYFI